MNINASITCPHCNFSKIELMLEDAADGRVRGLQGRGFLQKLSEQYERFRKDGKLPATFEVIYGHAWKPAARPKTKIDLEAGFAPVTFYGKK